MKYPIGIQSFDRIIEDGYVYVDKTDLIYSLVKGGTIYFLSRPRRFGKSLLMSTLKNYFLGRKELFRGLAIDRLEKDWQSYPVFHIDFNGRDFTRGGTLELESYFAEPITEMAEVFHCDVPQMKQLLKRQDDGYHFSPRLIEVYNPFSLLNAFDSMMMQDYWFRSGTPSYLIRLLNHTKENLDELTGRYYGPEEFIDYKADVEKPLPMIYQSGYLTIKDYNWEDNTFLLDFPNNEVKKGFLSMVAADYLKPRVDTASWVREAVAALKKGDTDKFRRLLTSFLSDIPYSMRRKENEREKERYFHYTFYLLLRLVSVYTVYTEKQQSEGRVDCIVETDHYVYIFEFKLDGTAGEALRQIEEKGYARPYLDDSRKLYCIGVSFSSETGTVDDWKVAE